jgi:hypothetical protein
MGPRSGNRQHGIADVALLETEPGFVQKSH